MWSAFHSGEHDWVTPLQRRSYHIRDKNTHVFLEMDSIHQEKLPFPECRNAQAKSRSANDPKRINR